MSALKTTINFLPSWANAPQAKRLPVFPETKSTSELSTFLACQVRHFYSYGLRRRPLHESAALGFGTLWHLGMAAWWKPGQDAAERFTSAVEAMTSDAVDPFMLVTLTELMRGYTARWSDAGYTAVAIEVEYAMPLVNPDTGEAHPTIGLMGIIDKVVVDATDKPHVMEHKSTQSEIDSGASYWDGVRTLDAQVSGYLDGARSLGYAVDDVIWDVVRKPTLKPYKATPEEERKYTQEKSRACKGCKKNPGVTHEEMVDDVAVSCVDGRIVTDAGGKLYATMRENDETPTEYGERIGADIAANPAKYFARGPIVRLEADELRHRRDTWHEIRQMADVAAAGWRVHNRFACRDFGGCDFRAVCEGRASIDDDTLFTKKTPRMQQIAHGEGETR